MRVLVDWASSGSVRHVWLDSFQVVSRTVGDAVSDRLAPTSLIELSDYGFPEIVFDLGAAPAMVRLVVVNETSSARYRIPTGPQARSRC